VTPAIWAAEHARVAFEVLTYAHDPKARAYGPEAATALGLPPSAVFKTLVAKLDGRMLLVALVAVDRTLDLKALEASAPRWRRPLRPSAGPATSWGASVRWVRSERCRP
jgi:Cys-tRNA(Pro)/Cys-tRNA(Cys) deacylase